MTIKNFINSKEQNGFEYGYSSDIYYYTDDDIEQMLKEFAILKCRELLEIVTEKAKIKDDDGDVYEQPMGFYCQGELYETWVDKDSIINAVNLDEFIV